jgi:hypothetical protein
MHRFLYYGLCAALLAASGCANTVATKTTAQPSGKLVFQRVAVAPFQKTTPEQSDINATDCSRCIFYTKADKPPDKPEAIIEKMFIDRIHSGYRVDVITPERVAGMYERHLMAKDKTTPLALLKKVGEDLEVDGIVFGYVYRYRELQGMPYAAAKPASVAFDVFLFKVSDSTLVWKGHFDKTQTSLMENILQASTFLKGGGRWVSVRELSEGGMDHIMRDFPAPSR